MNNLSGIYYRLWACVGIWLLAAILSFLLSRFWNSKKRDIKGIVVGICLLILALASGCWYVNAAVNPRIQTYEGYFCSQNRTSSVAAPLPFTWKYVFLNETGADPIFYLDTFSKKDIYPQEFDKDIYYRIYYEASTKIIVRVEVVAHRTGD